MARKATIAISAAIGATCLIVAWFLLQPRGDADQAKPFPGGVVLPLTGDAAVYGQALKNGIELALSEARNPPVRLIYEDDRGQATTAVSAARRLIDIEKVPVIIGGAMSSTAEATIPVCNAAHVVLISPTATKPSLTRISRYFFRLWPSDEYDGKVMADAAYNKLGLRRISIIYINLAYGLGITQVFEREFQQLGGLVVSKDGYAQGATDFRTLLTRVQSLRPDAIYLPGYVAEITQILKQAKELGLKPRFLGANSLYDPKLIEISGDAAEGAVFTYPSFDPQGTQPEIAGFVSAYKAKYGLEPDAFAAQGYDTLRVLLRALQGGARTGDQIRNSLLAGGRFEGPSGTFSFDEHGDVEKPLRLITVRNGKFVAF